MTTSTLFEPGTTPVTNTTFDWEVGTRFTATVSGSVTRIRYYKLSSESGTHTGKIWNSSGTLLGSVTFSGETASGWQEAVLSSPVAISPEETYTVSTNINSNTPSWDLTSPQPNSANQLNTQAGAFNNGTSGSYPATEVNVSFYGISLVFDDSITASPSLSQPSLTAINIANTGFTMNVSGGTSPYTVQLYRSTVSGFTPGVENLISGVSITGLTITVSDSTATPGITYFYKVVVTDSAPQAITSNQIPGLIAQYKLQIVFIGDSITASYACVAKTQAQIKALKKIFQVPNPINAAVSSTKSDDWISGSTNLDNAKSAAVSAFGSPSPSNPIWVSVMLGVNDVRLSPPGNSPATYKSNIQDMVNDLVGAGYKVILHSPPMIRILQGASNGYDTEAGMAYLQQYPAQLDSLVDNVYVFAGDRQAINYFATAWGEFIQDSTGGTYTYVHPNSAGEDTYAALWSRAIVEAVYPTKIRSRSIEV